MTSSLGDVSDWVVLIVDDDWDNLTVPEEILSFHGASVVKAEDGQAGLQALTNMASLPTFILLDLSMPVMNGWEMLENVRANPDTAHIPVIALTAHAMDEDKKQAMEAGFDGYITKPFWLHTFWEEINRCLAEMV